MAEGEGDVLLGTEASLPAETVESVGLPRPKTPQEAHELGEGAKYIDPQGKTQQIPYRPKSPEEAESLPEGSFYMTPDGKLMKVPKFEGLSFTAQTLYDMAVNDEERQAALERSYPGKVKTSKTGELHVEDEGGVLRKPKGFTEAPGAYLAAQAAPVTGAIAGEIGGAAAGSVLPGPGTFMGAVGGAAAGGAAGQAFNDAIMGLAGVYKRTGGEEAGALGVFGAAGGVGAGAGRAIGAAYPAIKGYLGEAVPKAINYALGTSKEGLETGIRLREEGAALVPVTPMFTEAAHVANMVEVFDPALRLWKPLETARKDFYEKKGGELLKGLGVKEPRLTEPEAAVSTEAAGQGVLRRATSQLQEADGRVDAIINQRRAGAEAVAEQRQSSIEQLRQADREARAAAERVVDAGFKDIDQTSKQALEASKAGFNSGALYQAAAEKIRKVRIGIGVRAGERYARYGRMTAGYKPDTSGLPELADSVLSEMPEGFEGQYPSMVRKIRDMAGQVDDKGEVVRPPSEPDLPQLHALRTAIRNNINYSNLTPDFREGALKLFAKRVDDALHDVARAPEQVREATKFLDDTDKWYGKVIRPLSDRNIQTILNGLESGLPADPKVLLQTLIREGRTELLQKVRKIVGPQLWESMRAADVQEMLAQSRSLAGRGMIDGRAFARQVADRYRSGLLESLHGPAASKLLSQARNIETLNGRLPMAAQANEPVPDIIARALQTAEQVKEAARQDPLKTLRTEMKGIDKERSLAIAESRKNLINPKLDFLYQTTTGAAQAVEKILGSEDLTIAAAAAFGRDSPEFNMLRQVWAERLLRGTLQPSAKLEKVSEEVQQLMFPGMSLADARQLAKDMDFLMTTKHGSAAGAGPSMAATAKVEHPWGTLGSGSVLGTAIKEPLKWIPGSDFVARAALTKYYSMVTSLTNNLTFLRWLMKGLKGNIRSREMVRETVQRRAAIGGAMGAGLAESQVQAPNVQ